MELNIIQQNDFEKKNQFEWNNYFEIVEIRPYRVEITFK